MNLTSEQNNYILELYKKSGNSPSRAVELYGEKFGRSVSSATIRRKWKATGYKPNPRGGQNNGLTDGQFRGLHNRYKGDMEKMMEDTGRRSPRSLVQRCDELNLEVYNVPKTKRRKSEPFPNHIV
jgi:hypothetical protein|tara:strand:- start:3949 stop:4323 length:375 start_codon:yes stop_codon:yes gene_type:complete